MFTGSPPVFRFSLNYLTLFLLFIHRESGRVARHIVFLTYIQSVNIFFLSCSLDHQRVFRFSLNYLTLFLLFIHQESGRVARHIVILTYIQSVNIFFLSCSLDHQRVFRFSLNYLTLFLLFIHQESGRVARHICFSDIHPECKHLLPVMFTGSPTCLSFLIKLSHTISFVYTSGEWASSATHLFF